MYLNGVKAHSAVLHGGDTLQIGDVVLVFRRGILSEPFFVRFWGTRGSIPTPGPRRASYGGNTSCVELTIDDMLFVCDGGTGLRELGLDAAVARAAARLEAHLFFSHMHWDHIQGFPVLRPRVRADHAVSTSTKSRPATTACSGCCTARCARNTSP